MADRDLHEAERGAEMEDWDGESLVEAPELPLEVRQNPISMYSLRKGRFYIDSTSSNTSCNNVKHCADVQPQIKSHRTVKCLILLSFLQVVVYILGFLRSSDRKEASLVCRKWYNASQDRQFQVNHFRQESNITLLYIWMIKSKK